MLGRHVGNRAERRAGAGEALRGGVSTQFVVSGGDFIGKLFGGCAFGQAEIENFGVAAFGDKNIGGLDVPVNDAVGVSGIQSIGNFHGQSEQ